MYNLLFWVAVQLLALWLLACCTEPYRNRKAFKLLFAPSAILEGLVRAIACCLAAKPVSKVEFFEDRKPFLTDDKSKIAVFGPILFLAAWLGLFFAVFHFWVTRVEGIDHRILALPHVNPQAISRGIIQIDARYYVIGLHAFFATTSWTSWQIWLLLYVIIGSLPFLAVSARQLQEGAVLIFFLALLTAAVNYFGIRPGFLSRGWYLSRWVLPEFFSVYSLLLTFIGLAFIPHFLAKLAGWAVQRWAERHAAAKKAESSKPRKMAHSHS